MLGIDPSHDFGGKDRVPDALQVALNEIETQAPMYADDLMEFVRVQSVSTDAAHHADIDVAAEWVAARLRRAGAGSVAIMPSAGNPVVVARWQVDDSLPTVVIYGHYDVQPPEPLELWRSPPFEPEIRDGKVYGRGASDDKAGVLIAIQAVEASAAATGQPPINVTFLLEGEEEIGSPNLPAFLTEHRDLLAADLAISADGGIFGVGVPSLTVGSRGLAGVEVAVRGANTDLHSGMYGGAVANPAMALAHILSSLQAPSGDVLVDGFYDNVPELTQELREAVAAIPDEDDAELAALGLSAWWGDERFTPQERRLLRPTLEVNGMWGGYQGAGIKTVLPSEAHAKITCRLVVGQEPDEIIAALTRHIEQVTPEGVRVTVKPLAGQGRAYQMPLDHPVLELAGAAMGAAYGREPFPVWTGGTVPVAEQFHRLLDTWCLYYAFGEPDNGLHAPNEFFRVSTLKQGTDATTRLFFAIAANPSALRSE